MNKSYPFFALAIITVMLISYNFTAYAEHTDKKYLKQDSEKTKSLKKETSTKKDSKKYLKQDSEKTKSLKKETSAKKDSKNYYKTGQVQLKSSKGDPVIPKTIQQQTPKLDKNGFKKAPELKGITGYVNTGPEELKEAMVNKVVLYDFWTYSCYNCQNTFPYVKSWHEKYSDKGLVVVGIHYPEFEFERDINNVKQAVANNGIKFPVVLDNDGVNWDAFGNRYWPRFYLADAEGYIRYNHIGEGAYDETENMIKLLLEEKNS